MALTKVRKGEITNCLKGALAEATSVVFVNFHGLSVADTTILRRGLKEKQVGYLVAKKTLLERVLSEVAPQGQAPVLEGEVAIAYGSDPIAPAKGVYDFQKARKEKDTPQILGGIFEGAYQDSAMMNALAAVPPKETLRGQFVNLLNSPLVGLVIALRQIAEKPVGAVN